MFVHVLCFELLLSSIKRLLIVSALISVVHLNLLFSTPCSHRVAEFSGVLIKFSSSYKLYRLVLVSVDSVVFWSIFSVCDELSYLVAACVGTLRTVAYDSLLTGV